jgi:DNA-3-methyladenine glycosylase
MPRCLRSSDYGDLNRREKHGFEHKHEDERMQTETLTRRFFERPPLVCAREMLGCTLTWGKTAGIIVETEAYAEHGDEASHAFVRPMTRTFIQDLPPGTLYIYLNYGVHWLLNFLTKGDDLRGFVLIRALQPVSGLDVMRRRRHLDQDRTLCSGPGKLTQALGINAQWHGKDFFSIPGVSLTRDAKGPAVAVDRRVGITKSAEFEWRFFIANSEYVSLKKGKPASDR